MLGWLGAQTVNRFNRGVTYHLPKEELLEFLLSKRDLLHIFIEYTFFCKFLIKLFSRKSDIEIALLRNAIVHHYTKAIHLENPRINKAVMLTFLGILCILIKRGSSSNKNNNVEKKEKSP